MKVLVIGGTLFIGRALVDELLKGGHEVAILHRKPAERQPSAGAPPRSAYAKHATA